MCPTRKSVYSSYSRTITALLCLLVAQAESSPFSGKSPMDAVELLTAFSGESAKQYEPFFRFSEEARIVGVEIHAVGTESTTARYSAGDNTFKEVNNILRITTADGFEGISGVNTYHEGEFSPEKIRELVSTGAQNKQNCLVTEGCCKAQLASPITSAIVQ